MVQIKELEERLTDVFDYIKFGKNLINNLGDKRIIRIADNFVVQLEIISDIYQRAIKKGENRQYSTEELREIRKSEFAEVGLYSWLLKDYGTDSKTAFETIDAPEILAYSLLLVLKDKYAPWIEEYNFNRKPN